MYHAKNVTIDRQRGYQENPLTPFQINQGLSKNLTSVEKEGTPTCYTTIESLFRYLTCNK